MRILERRFQQTLGNDSNSVVTTRGSGEYIRKPIAYDVIVKTLSDTSCKLTLNQECHNKYPRQDRQEPLRHPQSSQNPRQRLESVQSDGRLTRFVLSL